MMEFVGRRETSRLYWLLKVAVPQIRGGRIVESGGWIGGIFAGRSSGGGLCWFVDLVEFQKWNRRRGRAVIRGSQRWKKLQHGAGLISCRMSSWRRS